jgi:RNA methyltransferase, TrmH family
MTDSRIITSPANPVIKSIKALEMRKRREEEKLFIAEGMRHVREAVDTGWQVRTLVYQADIAARPAARDLIALCRKQGALCLEVTPQVLEKLTHRDNAETIVGVIEQRWQTLGDVSKTQDGLWVGLEEIRDPGNLGTILRTADSVGAAGVVLVGATCDPYSVEAIRASMGSFARVQLVRATGPEFLAWKQTAKIRMIGTHLKTDHDFKNVPYTKPLLLMMGNEQAGLSPAMTAACDQLVKIPMRGGADSLNLAIATGLMLFEAVRGNFGLETSGPVS